MTGRPAISRSPHLKPGTPVQHLSLGVGKVLCEWGPVKVEGLHPLAPCPGIYDCEFGIAPNRFLHCCRVEYLEKIGKAPGMLRVAVQKLDTTLETSAKRRLTAPR